ncbi:hypothetical protein [Streptomyces sp. BE133]|uniref:hypothetical protein n=1 Tax=Streptomyces sp. BE133 TaxID=3002523 RepID=UPI002E77791E|nr:hypothetical protein [Streptomyces sp. BE133]MEE1809852.1 hypothetical protein [Streptomyces sp. BE133]
MAASSSAGAHTWARMRKASRAAPPSAQGAGDVEEPVRLGAADAELLRVVRLPRGVAEREPDAGSARVADSGGEDRDRVDVE